jgi:hypothetical protein
VIVGAGAAAPLLFSQLSPAVSRGIEPPATQQPAYGWGEIWAGIDATHDRWLTYSGMTVAPWSRDIYSDGLRLRLGGGYGRYGYDGNVRINTVCLGVILGSCEPSSEVKKHYKVSQTYAELLIGYYLRLGALTAKAFAGAAASHQKHFVVDKDNHNDGTYVGAKGVLELWLDINPQTWTSFDISYTTARDETSARWRTGWRINPRISIGPELRFDKNRETGDFTGTNFRVGKDHRYEWVGQAGLFGRYEWQGGEVSIAGGLASPIENWTAMDRSIYGTVNVLFQF